MLLSTFDRARRTLSFRQNRNFGRGSVVVPYLQNVVYYLLELGVHGGFAVACEGDDVRCVVGVHHLEEFVGEQTCHVLAFVEGCLVSLFRPAAFAIDAVEGAELAFEREQVYAERKAQPPAAYRPEYDVVV